MIAVLGLPTYVFEIKIMEKVMKEKLDKSNKDGEEKIITIPKIASKSRTIKQHYNNTNTSPPTSPTSVVPTLLPTITPKSRTYLLFGDDSNIINTVGSHSNPNGGDDGTSHPYSSFGTEYNVPAELSHHLSQIPVARIITVPENDDDNHGEDECNNTLEKDIKKKSTRKSNIRYWFVVISLIIIGIRIFYLEKSLYEQQKLQSNDTPAHLQSSIVPTMTPKSIDILVHEAREYRNNNIMLSLILEVFKTCYFVNDEQEYIV